MAVRVVTAGNRTAVVVASAGLTQILWQEAPGLVGPLVTYGVDDGCDSLLCLSLIHISEPTRPY